MSVIDIGSEWRTFSNEATGADPCRVGSAESTLLNGSDLSTHIEGGHVRSRFDEFGNAKCKSRKTVSSEDRALMNAFDEISQIADRLHLPKTIVDRANSLFKTIHDRKKLRGRSTNSMHLPAFVLLPVRKEFLKLSKKFVLFLKPPRRKLEAAEDLGIVTGRSPLSVAVSGIYIVYRHRNLNVRQKEIGDVAG
ncbi:Transcription initiation factor IIB [Orchesella cincta]|uniref:Transcription initiation factor IIB n=1 Tax=Orchesella cincta TaxID=48709 RepID=A0A1D2M4T7_ORCCI|nr:Transcription initiation factor IIB [Orchesella cincta]